MRTVGIIIGQESAKGSFFVTFVVGETDSVVPEVVTMKLVKASVLVLTMTLAWLVGGVEARPMSTPGKGVSDAKPAVREVDVPAVAPNGPALPADTG